MKTRFSRFWRNKAMGVLVNHKIVINVFSFGQKDHEIDNEGISILNPLNLSFGSIIMV
jgi:hypothetical protein